MLNMNNQETGSSIHSRVLRDWLEVFIGQYLNEQCHGDVHIWFA